MKKQVLFLILVCLVIFVGAIVIKSLFFKDSIKYYLIKDGFDSKESVIISNYSEYQDFVEYVNMENKAYGTTFDFNSKKYNKSYFSSKSLAFIRIYTTTGMNKFKGIKFSIKNNKLICDVDIEYTKEKTVTMNMTGKVYLVEIDKKVTDIKINN